MAQTHTALSAFVDVKADWGVSNDSQNDISIVYIKRGARVIAGG